MKVYGIKLNITQRVYVMMREESLPSEHNLETIKLNNYLVLKRILKGNWVIPRSLFIKDGLLTDLKVTVGHMSFAHMAVSSEDSSGTQ